MRKIVHIDMEAFYASVEPREIRGCALNRSSSPGSAGVRLYVLH